jgi:hypothetical protein
MKKIKQMKCPDVFPKIRTFVFQTTLLRDLTPALSTSGEGAKTTISIFAVI